MKTPWPLIGNASVGQRLIELVDSDRLPSASVFLGPNAIGKRTGAVWLAQRDICQEENRPCGQCHDCRLSATGLHPRLTIVTGEKASSIGIDDIRRALERFTYVFDQRAWLVIPKAELLTESAQNALLKFSEEPPKNVRIILTVPHDDLLASTVLSRLVAIRRIELMKKPCGPLFPPPPVKTLSKPMVDRGF